MWLAVGKFDLCLGRTIPVTHRVASVHAIPASNNQSINRSVQFARFSDSLIVYFSFYIQSLHIGLCESSFLLLEYSIEYLIEYSSTRNSPNYIAYCCTLLTIYRVHQNKTPRYENRNFKTFVQMQNSRSLSWSFRHFGVHVRRVNTAWNSRLVEQTSKIWCKNIHAFLRNCGFRVGAFYFDAPCIVDSASVACMARASR